MARANGSSSKTTSFGRLWSSLVITRNRRSLLPIETTLHGGSSPVQTCSVHMPCNPIARAAPTSVLDDHSGSLGCYPGKTFPYASSSHGGAAQARCKESVRKRQVGRVHIRLSLKNIQANGRNMTALHGCNQCLIIHEASSPRVEKDRSRRKQCKSSLIQKMVGVLCFRGVQAKKLTDPPSCKGVT